MNKLNDFFTSKHLGSNKIPVLILLIAISFSFWPLLIHFFSIDDFGWLYVAKYKMNTITQWLQAFTHINGSGQYRPLSQQVFFWLNFHLFGLNALGFHITNFVIFLIACWYVYKLLLFITKQQLVAIFVSVFFCFSVVNFGHIIWVSAVTETLASLCVAAALYFSASDKKNIAAMWYVLGLMSNETTIILPALVFVYYLFYSNLSIYSAFLKTKILWLILGVYFILRMFVFGGIPAHGAFLISLSPVVWFDELIRSINSSFGFNPVMRNIISLSIGWKLAIFIPLIVLVGVNIYSVIIKSKSVNTRLIIIGLLWFLIGLLPVLPFSHNFANYNISIAIIGLPVVVVGILGTKLTVRHLLVASSFIILMLINLYGPNGLYFVDGNRLLSKSDHLAYIQMKATEERIHTFDS